MGVYKGKFRDRGGYIYSVFPPAPLKRGGRAQALYTPSAVQGGIYS